MKFLYSSRTRRCDVVCVFVVWVSVGLRYACVPHISWGLGLGLLARLGSVGPSNWIIKIDF